jgi:hypothetical protein
MSFATLDGTFFKQMRPAKSFFLRHAALYSWSVDCLPVYEWEGLLFVACTNPEDITPERNWVLVKAQSSDLKTLWNDWSDKASEDPSELFFNAQEIVTAIPEQPHAPEGLHGFEESLSVPQNSQSFNATSTDPETLDYQSKKDLPTAAALPEVLKSDFSAINQQKTNDKNQKTKNTLEKSFEEIDEIFSALSKNYSKIMVLIKEKDTLSPWRWSQTFHHTSLNDSVYDLSMPSPFRIVSRTSLPFHGTPQKSDILDQFVQNWNSGKYPGNLTIAPVMMNDQVIAMLLCFGEPSTFTKSHLLNVNKKSEEIATIFQKIPPIQAAS